MLGVIVGDIVGSRFEFNNTRDYDFTLFGEDCSYTDDTICAVAIAYALVYNKPYDAALRSMCALYPHPMGAYGSRFEQWLWSDDPKPYNSFDNGAAMRVAPVAWWYDTLEDVLRESEKTALPTHNHPEGVKGAVSVAHAIFYLRNGGTKEGLEKIADHYYPNFANEDLSFERWGWNESCQYNVPLAFQIVLRSNSFVDAIRLAVSSGGDSDTLAAIVGAIAEPLWGIPDQVADIAVQFLDGLLDQTIGKFYECLTKRELENEQE